MALDKKIFISAIIIDSQKVIIHEKNEGCYSLRTKGYKNRKHRNA